MSTLSVGLAMTLTMLAPEAALLEDPAGSLDVETVQALDATSFKAADEGSLNLGLTDSTWWLRIAPPAGTGFATNSAVLLVIPYPQNDELTLYQRTGSEWTVMRAGDLIARSEWPLDHPWPVFPITAATEGPMYLRAASSGSLNLPLQFWQERKFWQEDLLAQTGYGLYYAVLLSLALYNLFLWAVVRDRAYLYYVLYLSGLLLFQASFSGHATWLLWPESPAWGSAATAVGLGAAIGFGCFFVINMGRTAVAAPRWHRGLLGLAAISFLAVACVPWSYRLALVVLLGASIVAAVLFLGAVLTSLLAGVRQARFLLIGFISFMPGGVLLALRALDQVPDNWWTAHSYQLGSALEALLLSFALADRINLLNRERDGARAALDRERDEAARRLIEVQDTERRRIARDLHDSLGQHLLALLPTIRGIPGEAGARTDRGLRAAVREVRRIAHSLYPQQLDRLGLAASLRSLVEHMAPPAGLQSHCDIEACEPSRAQALAVYRIAQEALSNVVKHSGAREVRLSWRRRNAGAELVIEDDGRGPSAAGAADGGQGLVSMRARAQRIGACFSIEPATGGGTRLRISGIPLPPTHS
mgnify:CR=1 FL=1